MFKYDWNRNRIRSATNHINCLRDISSALNKDGSCDHNPLEFLTTRSSENLCLCFLHTKKNPWDKGWCDFLQLFLPTSLWCLQQISELELQVKRYKEDINKFRTEHGILTNKLAEKTKVNGYFLHSFP